MHVAIDIDETITAAPAFFSWLAKALRRDGHEVSILSLRRGREGAIRDLEEFRVGYDHLELLPLDFEGDVIQWKVKKVEELGIEVLIDDLVDLANQVGEGVFVMVPRDLGMGFLEHLDETVASF